MSLSSNRWLENIANTHTTTVLAVDSGDIVGEASLVHSEAGWTEHIGEIRVTVNSQIRGHGLGRFLAEEIFASRGLHWPRTDLRAHDATTR